MAQFIVRKFRLYAGLISLGMLVAHFSCFAQPVDLPTDALHGTYVNAMDAQMSFSVENDTLYFHPGKHEGARALLPFKLGNRTAYRGSQEAGQPIFAFDIDQEGARYVTVEMWDTARYYRQNFIPFSHAHWTFEMNNTPKYAARIYAHHPLVVHGKLLLNAAPDIDKFTFRFYQRNGAVSAVKTYACVNVNAELKYEIGGFHTASGKDFAHLLIWQADRGFDKRMFEIIAEKGKASPAARLEIDAARQAWLKLCNAHLPGKLVADCYTDDAIYYNRGRVLRGTEALSEEYAYMANPNYSLDLIPTHVEVVSDTMAFEIGRCQGSYNLPYLLVWERQVDGAWKIHADSNY